MTTSSPLAVSVSAVIGADPTTLYDLVSDVTRMGEWSPETVGARWLGGATAAEPGARFVGTNAIGSMRWKTRPTVVTAERGSRFAFQVPGASGPLWTYEFRVVDGGTCVTESMVQTTSSPMLIRWLRARAGVIDRREHLRQGMLVTLARVGAAAVAAKGSTCSTSSSIPARAAHEGGL